MLSTAADVVLCGDLIPEIVCSPLRFECRRLGPCPQVFFCCLTPHACAVGQLGDLDVHGWVARRSFVICVAAAGVLLPLSWLPSMKPLQYTSFLSIACVILFVAVIVVEGVIKLGACVLCVCVLCVCVCARARATLWWGRTCSYATHTCT